MVDVETYRFGKNGKPKIRIYFRKQYKKARFKRKASRQPVYCCRG